MELTCPTLERRLPLTLSKAGPDPGNVLRGVKIEMHLTAPQLA